MSSSSRADLCLHNTMFCLSPQGKKEHSQHGLLTPLLLRFQPLIARRMALSIDSMLDSLVNIYGFSIFSLYLTLSLSAILLLFLFLSHLSVCLALIYISRFSRANLVRTYVWISTPILHLPQISTFPSHSSSLSALVAIS